MFVFSTNWYNVFSLYVFLKSRLWTFQITMFKSLIWKCILRIIVKFDSQKDTRCHSTSSFSSVIASFFFGLDSQSFFRATLLSWHQELYKVVGCAVVLIKAVIMKSCCVLAMSNVTCFTSNDVVQRLLRIFVSCLFFYHAFKTNLCMYTSQ